MSTSDVADVRDAGSGALSAAQTRIVTAALELFARHGVGGTSLQMIADEIGVTKAAVYHQYKTKDEIILAAAEAELARLEAVIDAAETEPSPKRARDALITGMVDLAVDRRRTTSTILSDPVIVGFFADHETFRDVMHRLREVPRPRELGPVTSIPRRYAAPGSATTPSGGRAPADAGAEEVAQADDADQRVVLDHGEVAEPAAEHDLRGSLGVDLAPDGFGVTCHPPGHR